MNIMYQTEHAKPRVQIAVRVDGPVPVDSGTCEGDSIQERISAGQAFLKVIEYPWGLEFDVCSVERTQ